MIFYEAIGFLAACCTTVAFLPQAWRVHRTRSTHDLSLGMFSIFAFGVAAWLLYGLLIGSRPVIAANAITLPLTAYILWMKLKEGRRW